MIIRSNLELLSLEILQKANHKETTSWIIAYNESCNCKSDSTPQPHAVMSTQRCLNDSNEIDADSPSMNDSSYEDVCWEWDMMEVCVCVCTFWLCVSACASGGGHWMGCLTMVLIISMIYELVWCHSAIRETVSLCSPHLVSSPSLVSVPQNNCVLMGEKEGKVVWVWGGLDHKEDRRIIVGDGSLLTEEIIRCDDWPFQVTGNHGGYKNPYGNNGKLQWE